VCVAERVIVCAYLCVCVCVWQRVKETKREREREREREFCVYAKKREKKRVYVCTFGEFVSERKRCR